MKAVNCLLKDWVNYFEYLFYVLEIIHLFPPLLLLLLFLLLVLELSFLLVPLLLVSRLLLRRQVGGAFVFCFVQPVHDLIDLLLHHHTLHLVEHRASMTHLSGSVSGDNRLYTFFGPNIPELRAF